MCGICGVAGGEQERERVAVQRMTSALAHRGPDDTGESAHDGCILGNRRLAIIDVSAAGHQPMCSSDGRFWITFNGEIYNYHELRQELVREGQRFRTQTDTEVLLELYRRLGAGCLERLRGMYAFAVWDRGLRTLFAARDPFGQKPFYYAVAQDRLIFASEIKAILAHGDVTAEPDLAAADHYLSLRFIPAPFTMFSGIRKLPAGHWLQWHEGSLRVERYWEPEFGSHEIRPKHDWLEGLRERIEAAVADHVVGDVRVGAFLSGGLDSSAVVAAMHRRGEARIATFCVGSDVAHLDERAAARTMADHCGTKHHEVRVSADVLRRIPRLVRQLDEPSDPIALCIDTAAELAASHVKVALGGDGGDEVFAGFDRYAAFQQVARLSRLPARFRRGVIIPLLKRIPESTRYKSLSQKTAWLASVLSEQGGRQYGRMTTHFRFQTEQKLRLYGPVLRAELSGQDPVDVIARAFDAAPADTVLDRMIHADLLTRFPEHTLMLSDRLGMSYGLEIRSPLLDLRLARFCFSMPPSLRIHGRTTKYALRKAISDWIPPELTRRPKQGFMLPIGRWLAGPAMRQVSARLVESRLVREQWIQKDAVELLLREHSAGRADHHVRIWMLLSLDAWYRRYIDGTAFDVSETDHAEPRVRSDARTDAFDVGPRAEVA